MEASDFTPRDSSARILPPRMSGNKSVAMTQDAENY